MSTSTQPASDHSAPSAKGVSVGTLILSLALAVSLTAASILAFLHFRQPGNGGGGGPPVAIGEGPLVQKDTVSPRSKFTGTVYYPIPYASPPNLKLTASKREYDIVRQDETGFTWMARSLPEDLREDMRKDHESEVGNAIEGIMGWMKPNIVFEDFTWEAKGVRDAGGMRAFEQTGTFNTVFGKEGEVNFTLPYALAPNVTLSGTASGAVIVEESSPTGFKWKNVATIDNGFSTNGEITWTAKGVRTTEVPKPKP